MSNELLNPERFKKLIAREPAFLNNMPRLDRDSIGREQFYKKRANAIRMGSIAITDDLTEKHGEYNLDANLFSLVGNITPYLIAQRAVDAYGEKYANKPLNQIPYFALEQIQHKKRDLIAFNRSLKDVINSGGSKFDFQELLTFMTNMNTSFNGNSTRDYFFREARSSLVGAENEVGFGAILIASGIEYQEGSEEEDARGGDFIIDDTSIDVKSSPEAVIRAQRKAIEHGYDPSHIIWSQINHADFRGKLILSRETIIEKVPAVTRVVAQATNTSGHLQRRA